MFQKFIGLVVDYLCLVNLIWLYLAKWSTLFQQPIIQKMPVKTEWPWLKRSRTDIQFMHLCQNPLKDQRNFYLNITGKCNPNIVNGPIHLRNDLQKASGWIDLLLLTPNEWIIVDHCTFPGKESDWIFTWIQLPLNIEAMLKHYSRQLGHMCTKPGFICRQLVQ